MGRRKDRVSKDRPHVDASKAPAPNSLKDPNARKYVPLVQYCARVGIMFMASYFIILYSTRPVLDRATGKGASFTDAFRFVDFLINDPYWVILRLSAGLFILQGYFGIWLEEFVLPPNPNATGFGQFGQTGHHYQDLLKRARAALDPKNGSLFLAVSAIVKALFYETCFILGVGSLAIFGIAVLLGAPVLSSLGETAVLSLFLSILIITPVSFSLGKAHPYTWRRFLSLDTHTYAEKALIWPSVGGVVGAFLGAFPIPLDWNEPWQKYPTTIVLGALLGTGAGHLVSVGTMLTAAALDPRFLTQ